MPDGRLRRARLGDLPDLLALEAHFPTDRLSRAGFRHLLMHGHADVLVYLRAGQVLGNAVVLYRRGSRRARLYSLVTHPAHRGTGIGRLLLAAAERAACRRGCAEIHLEVRSANRTAIRLYRGREYKVTRRIARFYEDGADALRLGKTLARQRGSVAAAPGRRSASHSR
jgi:ribosomal protein S18 acetylase RimI-like enzyme